MKIQALIVADDPVFHSWLQNAAQGAEVSLVHADTLDELLDHIDTTGRVDVVFFEFNEVSSKHRARLIEGLLERMPDIAVAGLGQQGDSSLMLAAMRAGARDFFILGQDEANLSALLSRLLKRPASSVTGDQQKGRIFGVMSAVPYEGIAFLAEHIALACHEQIGKGSRVLLVDVALPAGAASIFLNLNQTYGVLDAINDGSRCDATLVDTAFAKHKSGLYVLSLPEDVMSRPPIDGDDLVTLLSVLRGLFSCIVVCFDGHLPLDTQKALIKLSSRTVVLTDQSILKSRHSKYLLRAMRLEEAPVDRLGLVVDNYRRRVGLEAQNLSELLELPVLATLSSSGDHRIQAMNQGEPMFECAPKDEYCGGVRDLAASLLDPSSRKHQSTPVTGLLGKLFSK